MQQRDKAVIREAIMREILRGGGETKWADLDGFTALVYASMWGHAEVVEVLINQLYSNKMKVKLIFQEIDADGSGGLNRDEILNIEEEDRQSDSRT